MDTVGGSFKLTYTACVSIPDSLSGCKCNLVVLARHTRVIVRDLPEMVDRAVGQLTKCPASTTVTETAGVFAGRE